MQVAAGILICVTLYYSTPKTYLSTSDENYLKVFDLIKQLQSVPEEKSGEIIDDFIRDTGIDLAIYNAEKSTYDKKVFAETDSKLSLKTEEEVQERIDELNDKEDNGIHVMNWHISSVTQKKTSCRVRSGKACR